MEKMQDGVSIIICCYNSEKRIVATLKHISEQVGIEEIDCELILVDNNCSDDTVKVATDFWKQSNSSNIKLSIITQPIAGLSAAREKGIEESKYAYLLFCDDDNWLCNNFIKSAFNIISTNEKIGVLGGLGIPECEIKPPDWFELFSYNYAIGIQNDHNGKINNKSPFVYGAGSVYRKGALVKLVEEGFSTLASGRKGKKLSSGEDVELCMAINKIGYEIWYNDNLKFQHFIPKERLTIEYLKRLQYSLGYTGAYHLPYKWVFAEVSIPSFKKTWWWVFLGVFVYIVRIELPRFIGGIGSDNYFKFKIKLINQLGFLIGVFECRKLIPVNYLKLMNAKWVKNIAQ